MLNFQDLFRKLYDFWLDLIFPKFCLGCGNYDSYLCEPCFTGLPRLKQQRCIVCQKPSLNGFTHPKCQTKFTPERLVTLFPYQNRTISKLIRAGKYQFVPEIFQLLARFCSVELSQQLTSDSKYDMLSIPLHKKKHSWRGFNQADVFAVELSKLRDIRLTRGLNRWKFTKPQMDLNAKQRMENLKSSFVFSGPEKQSKYLLLVDDITTTGSTFLHATKAIKSSRDVEVVCFAIAQD